MTSTDSYYTILGVSQNASLGEIKTAYTSKAKYLHPDINKAPDAHEKFILLHEAYEYLQKVKTGSMHATARRRTYGTQHKAKTREELRREEVERIRARARQYAKMQYEEYMKQDHHVVNSLNYMARYLGYYLSIGSLAGLPVLYFILDGTRGFFIGLFASFMILPVTVRAITAGKKVNAFGFKKAVRELVKKKDPESLS